MPSSPDPSSMPATALLILLFCFIILSGFFAIAETALLSLNRNKLKLSAQEGNSKTKFLLDIEEKPDHILSSIQMIITFAGFLTAAILAIRLFDPLLVFLTKYGVPYAGHVSLVLITLAFSYITLVFGRLYPRRIALLRPEKIALALVRPIYVCSLIVKPLEWVISKSVSLLLFLTRQQAEAVSEEFSEDEVMSMLEAGKESGAIKEEGQKMITSIFAFDDKLAYEIMTPRTDVFTIDIGDSEDEYIEELMELRYTRIPVCENDSDNIIGILNIKDYLIKARLDGFDHVDIRSILRKPYFVPETKNIDALFVDLKNAKQHIAILIDEYGGFSGIVTMEDIIEEIMGEIDDEFDEEEDEIEQIGENVYRIDGFINLDDLNDALGLSLESDNIETIGGFLIDILGEIPEDGDPKDQIIEYENCIFKIESVKERRIEKVLLTIQPEAEETEDQS